MRGRRKSSHRRGRSHKRRGISRKHANMRSVVGDRF